MVQDDVNARLEASESKPSAKVPASSNGTNPATTLGKESDSGLAKLDAGVKADETPVEDKVEAVAGAIGQEEEATPEATQVDSLLCYLSSPSKYLSSLRKTKSEGQICLHRVYEARSAPLCLHGATSRGCHVSTCHATTKSGLCVVVCNKSTSPDMIIQPIICLIPGHQCRALRKKLMLSYCSY